VVACFFPLKKSILFGSIPVIADNSGAVFFYMIRRKLNNNFKLVWMVDCPSSYPKIKNVKLLSKKSLIVLKLHFVQDVSYVKDLGMSNIRFINDEFYVDNKISSYEFI